MTFDSKSVERSKAKAGARRKEIEKALSDSIQKWLDGSPGDICMGELYRQFFMGAKK